MAEIKHYLLKGRDYEALLSGIVNGDDESYIRRSSSTATTLELSVSEGYVILIHPEKRLTLVAENEEKLGGLISTVNKRIDFRLESLE